MEKDREGTGALFPAKVKKSEKSPDVSGNIIIGGKKVMLVGWKRTSKGGMNYISIMVSKPMEGKSEAVEEMSVKEVQDLFA